MISLFDKKFTLLFTKFINNYDTINYINTSNTNNSLMNKVIYPYFERLLEKDNYKIAKITKDFSDDDYDIWIIKYKDYCYESKNVNNGNIEEFRSNIQINNRLDNKIKLVYDFIIPYNCEQNGVFKIKDTLNFFIDSRFIKFLNTEINKNSLNDTINLFYYILMSIKEKEPSNNSVPNLYLYDTWEDKNNNYNKLVMHPQVSEYVIVDNNVYKHQSVCLVAAIYHMYKILLKQDYFGGENLIENMYNNSDRISRTFVDKKQFGRIMDKLSSM